MKDLVTDLTDSLASAEAVNKQFDRVFGPWKPGYSEPDGPIREPGDDVPEWSDVYSTDELVAALDYHSAQMAAKHGNYDGANELSMAAKCIADLKEKLDFERDQQQLYRNGQENAKKALAVAQARIAELEREKDGGDWTEGL